VFTDDAGIGRLAISVPHTNVYRAVPHLPMCLGDNYDLAIAYVRTLVLAELARADGIGSRFEKPVQWFYTPMPAPAMLGAFDEIGVVYDCMDELSKFRFAHPDLVRRERLLLGAADVVFTGGRKLWESKSRLHDNVHFFGCGVDSAHFATARDPETEVPDDIAVLRTPGTRIAGYYGVVDERLDYDLIAQLAASDPTLQVVMVGPVVKVDPASLPQAPNLHWFGGRSYDQLPGYVSAFDVCLMPFALNEATEYINPTKTLEYMAAGRPIVSTAVADVVRNFTPVVRVARNAREFVSGVLRDAAHPDAARIADGIEMARGASWEKVVSSMSTHVLDAIDARTRAASARTRRVGERSGERVFERAKERAADVAPSAARASA
jgi:glycosyltransferase involved in cell wall biosynthesis